MARCTATKANGDPCRSWAMKGRDVCKPHSGDEDVGRPTKLTEDLQHRVTQLLRNGNYAETAAIASGISPATYYHWIEQGEADVQHGRRTEFSEFSEACERARAEAEAVMLNQIRQAGAGTLRAETDEKGEPTGRMVGKPGDWKATAWVLEKTRRDRFGQHSKVEHGGGVKVRNEPVIVPEDDERLVGVGETLYEIGVLDEA
jgi:hypothetical protein